MLVCAKIISAGILPHYAADSTISSLTPKRIIRIVRPQKWSSFYLPSHPTKDGRCMK